MPVISCAQCRKRHKKCTIADSGDACESCLELGYECELPRLLLAEANSDILELEPEGEAEPELEAPPQPAFTPAVKDFQRPQRSLVKCDTCRRHHMTCDPVDRVWPQKCKRCIDKGYDCSAPRSKKEFDEAAGQENADGQLLGATGMPRRRRRRKVKHDMQPQQHSEDLFQPIVSDVIFGADGAASDGDGSSSEASIPAVLPAKRPAPGEPWAAAGPPPPKRQQANNHHYQAAASDAGSAEGQKLVQLKGMVRSMEEEFREVLRGEQAKHDEELNALRTRYEKELSQQRERYESRIDDLIGIMKSIGRVG